MTENKNTVKKRTVKKEEVKSEIEFQIRLSSVQYFNYGKVLNCVINQNETDYHVSFKTKTSYNHTIEENLRELALKLFFNKEEK